MAIPRVLIVEDENIVAMDLRYKLEDMGYSVLAVARSGEEAVERVAELSPDLVLMDIVLDGRMDGIEAAGHIRDRWDTPVVYLTAHSDEAILARAKIAEPFGYLVKPVNPDALRAGLQTAIYNHGVAQGRRQKDRMLSAFLTTGDAILAFDEEGYITFMDRIAQSLSGWDENDALGKPLGELVNIAGRHPRNRLDELLRKSLRAQTVTDLPAGTALITKNRGTVPIEGNLAGITSDDGVDTGGVLRFWL